MLRACMIAGALLYLCSVPAWAAYNPTDGSGDGPRAAEDKVKTTYEARLGISDAKPAAVEVDRDRLFGSSSGSTLGDPFEEGMKDPMADARKKSLAFAKEQERLRAERAEASLAPIRAKMTGPADANVRAATATNTAYFTFQLVFFLVIVAGLGYWYWVRRKDE